MSVDSVWLDITTTSSFSTTVLTVVVLVLVVVVLAVIDLANSNLSTRSRESAKLVLSLTRPSARLWPSFCEKVCGVGFGVGGGRAVFFSFGWFFLGLVVRGSLETFSELLFG